MRKTGARSQVELVRLSAAVRLAIPGNAPQLMGQHNGDPVTTELIEIEPGRMVQVDLMGPENGLPILLVHGFMSGTRFTRAGYEALEKHGLRIIAPWRPHFGQSGPLDASIRNFPQILANDIGKVLAHYRVDKTVVMARYAGAIHATAAAQKLPDLIAGICVVSGTVPIRHRRQLDDIGAWQRVFAYSARYFPAAIPMLIRGALQLLMKNGEDAFVAGMYPEPEIDVLAIAGEEEKNLTAASYRHSFLQGSRGYELEVCIAASDWSDHYRGMNQPVNLVHGDLDPVTRIGQVRDLASDFPHLQLDEIAGGGQLLLYSHPDEIFARVARFARPLLKRR